MDKVLTILIELSLCRVSGYYFHTLGSSIEQGA